MVSAGVQLLVERMQAPPLVQGLVARLVSELERSRQSEAETRQELRRLRQQLQQVAEIQADLLPKDSPDITGLEVRTFHRPADMVSGDFHQIVRLDADRTAFILGDATGHGLPAGMLAALMQRSLTPCSDGDSSAGQPNRILARAHREILDLALSECQSLGVLYAVYDETRRTMTWSRGGAPYPILVRAGESPRQILSRGPALGAVDEAEFETVTVTLQSGDRLVFHTDGVDALLLTDRGRPVAGDLAKTDWYNRLAFGRLDASLQQLDDRRNDARSAGRELDDVTIIAVEARGL